MGRIPTPPEEGADPHMKRRETLQRAARDVANLIQAHDNQEQQLGQDKCDPMR